MSACCREGGRRTGNPQSRIDAPLDGRVLHRGSTRLLTNQTVASLASWGPSPRPPGGARPGPAGPAGPVHCGPGRWPAPPGCDRAPGWRRSPGRRRRQACGPARRRLRPGPGPRRQNAPGWPRHRPRHRRADAGVPHRADRTRAARTVIQVGSQMAWAGHGGDVPASSAIRRSATSTTSASKSSAASHMWRVSWREPPARRAASVRNAGTTACRTARAARVSPAWRSSAPSTTAAAAGVEARHERTASAGDAIPARAGSIMAHLSNAARAAGPAPTTAHSASRASNSLPSPMAAQHEVSVLTATLTGEPGGQVSSRPDRVVPDAGQPSREHVAAPQHRGRQRVSRAGQRCRPWASTLHYSRPTTP